MTTGVDRGPADRRLRGPRPHVPGGWLGVRAGFPEDAAAFPRRTRRAWTAWMLLTLPVAALAGLGVETPADYLAAFVRVAILVSVPAVVACAVAANRARPAGERPFWCGWTAAVGSVVVTGFALGRVAEEDVAGLRGWSLPVVVLTTILFMVPDVVMMRRRSGRRSVTLDVVETLIAATIACGLLGAVLSGPMAASPYPWFTTPCAFAVITGVVSLAWTLTLFRRAPAEHRRLELLAVVLSALAVADAAAQLAQGLQAFTLPAPPLLVLHQLTLGVLLLVPLHAARVRTPGLERLSPTQQVRGSRGLTLLTIATVPLLWLATGLVADQPHWYDQVRVGAIAVLAVLLALRALLALDETKRLYGEVAAAAEERQALLHALTHSRNDERHRFAVQLHQQAISSYAAFATYLDLAAHASRAGGDPLPETSRRLRADLSHTAETWRRFMLAVRPPAPSPRGSAASLTVSIRAYVAGLFRDGSVPPLTVAVHPALRLDWATEALVLRVLQEGIDRARRRGSVAGLHVAVARGGRGLQVHLSTVGATAGERDGDLDALRALVSVVDGTVAVEPAGTGQDVLVADLGVMGEPPGPGPRPGAPEQVPARGPRLHVVRDEPRSTH